MTKYEKYQLQWMIDHDCSIQDLITNLNDLANDEPHSSIDKLYNQWEFDRGFNGSIWACKMNGQ